MNILFIQPSINDVTKASFQVLDYFKKYHQAKVDYVFLESRTRVSFKSENDPHLNTSFDFYKNKDLNQEGLELIQKIDSKFPRLIKKLLLIDRHIGRNQFINEIIYVGTKDATNGNLDFFTSDIVNFLLFANNIFTKKNYRFVLGCSGNFRSDFFSLLSDYYSIPFWEVFFSRTQGDKTPLRYLTNNYIKNNFLFSKEKYDAVKISDTSRTILEQSRKSRSTKYLVYYRPRWKHFFISFAKDLYWMMKYRPDSKFYQERALSKIFFLMFYKFQRKFLGKMKMSELKTDQERKSVLIALAQLPEIVLLSWAEKYNSQINYINQILYNLPTNWFINLREHPHNVGYRPLSFVAWARSLRNTRIVSLDESQYVQLQKSDACITTSGTIGWESLLLRKPVFTFTKTFYDLTGLNYYLSSFDDLNNIDSLIERFNAFKKDDSLYDERLLKLISLEEETCFNINIESSFKKIIDQMLETKFTPYWQGK